jgi:DNA-binding LacI/PurR family transcriptional regulator
VIDNNARQMGELAARLLLARLEQPGPREFSDFRVGGRLVERDSCAAPAGR